MKLVSVAEMIQIEKAADAAGHSYAMMMENAGHGLAAEIQQRYGKSRSKKIAALVGSGNNGGDALVALDYLLEWGWEAAAVILRARQADDPLLDRLKKHDCQLLEFLDPEFLQDNLDRIIPEVDILIDGILGTGIRLPLREPLDQQMAVIKDYLGRMEKPPTVVAVDCPSGVDCDSGEVSQSTFPADLTVTMAAVKSGLLKFPAFEYLGALVLVGIGLPPDLKEFSGIKREVILPAEVLKSLPKRPIDAHKGTFGTSLIVAGSEQYPGAAYLSGLSAYRAGSGLVTVAVPKGIYSGLIKSLPEATWIKLPDSQGGIAKAGVEQIKAALRRPTACLVGPGLGMRAETGKFLEDLICINGLPRLVVDADGLRLLAKISKWSQVLPRGTVLTPHPGEMSALTGLSTGEIQSDRLGTAERFAAKWGQVVLLKGANTVIASPDGRTRVLMGAEPALARAGSGDVLAGVITGLIAQGMEPFEAAAAGAWIHLRAGQLAAEKTASQASVLAGDISAEIGRVLAGV